MRFNGLEAPSGEGYVVEAHLDIWRSAGLESWLEQEFGFEADPFSVFYPKGYEHHMTGRLRVSQKDLRETKANILMSLNKIMHRARTINAPMYAEVEIEREVARFTKNSNRSFNPGALAGFAYEPTGKYGEARVDIHLCFDPAKVTTEMEIFFLTDSWYWVETPATRLFDAEKIATLQAEGYHSALQVYQGLSSAELPGLLSQHLEQKLAMIKSHEWLPTPQVIRISKAL